MLRPACLALCLLVSVPVGAQDLAFALDFNSTGGFNTACLNDGTGAYACGLVSTNTDRHRSRDVAAADLDGDGDDDLAFAVNGGASLSAANRLCLAGGGGFTCSDVSTDLHDSDGVAAADLDGDGDTDLAFADRAVGGGGAANRVCLNDGAAGFTCADVSPDLGVSTDIATTDADGDGDTDLVVVNFFGPDRLCVNDGAAAFTCAPISTDTGDTHGVTSADLDGDGDQDLAFANPITNVRTRTNRVCLNDGSGSYTCAAESADTDNSQDVVALDADGDGDQDLAFANESFFTFGGGRGINRLCRNDGSAGFTCEDIQPQRNDAFGVVVGAFGGTPVAADPDEAAAGFALAIAPNPARRSATVRYTLAEPGRVTLTVHDLLGRVVSTLAEGDAAAGSHQAHVGTAGMAAGVYVVRLIAPGFVGTQRLTVVR